MTKTMNKDVLISIKGTVVSPGGMPEVIELVTEGRYYNRNGAYYISYHESEATGFEGVTTTLKVDGDHCVTLIRNGSQRSRLTLEKGRRHLCQYDTGYGYTMLGISGCKIKSGLGDIGGELVFNYTLDVDSNTVSQNEVYVSVKEADSHDKSNPIGNQ